MVAVAHLDGSHGPALALGHQDKAIGSQAAAELAGVGGAAQEFLDAFRRIERSHKIGEYPDNEVADLLLLVGFHGPVDDGLIGFHHLV